MQNLFRFLLLSTLGVSCACGQGTRKIGDVTVVVDNQTIPIRVHGSTPDLQAWASLAFSAHGRYDTTGRRPPARSRNSDRTQRPRLKPTPPPLANLRDV